MNAKLKKIFFWLLFGVSLFLLILSIFTSAKPEWFEWLPTLFGWDETTTKAVMASFGFGGTAGTLGFSIAKLSLSGALTKGKDLSEKTIQVVKENTLDVVKKSEDKYQDILSKFTTQNETISQLVISDEKSKEAFEALANVVKVLVDLEVINLNKTLDNPLVNAETKEKITLGLQNAGIIKIPEIIIPEETTETE